MPATEEEPKAANEHAKHLRTVHFALIVLSLSLLIGTNKRVHSTFSPKNARIQLSIVSSIVSNWADQGPHGVFVRQVSSIEERFGPLLLQGFSIDDNILNPVTRVDIPSTVVSLIKVQVPTQSNAPTNLNSFRSIWNSSPVSYKIQVFRAHEVENWTAATGREATHEIEPLRVHRECEWYVPSGLENKTRLIGSARNLPVFETGKGEKGGFFRVFPNEMQKHVGEECIIGWREWLNSQHGVNSNSDANKAFGDLIEVAKLSGSLSLDVIKNWLDIHAPPSKTGSSPIQVWGVQLNNDLVSLWGPLLLIATMTYFAIHHNVYSTRYSRVKSTAAWIGNYAAWFAIPTTVLTAAILPVWGIAHVYGVAHNGSYDGCVCDWRTVLGIGFAVWIVFESCRRSGVFVMSR